MEDVKCRVCKRTKKELDEKDIDLRKVGNPKLPEYICDDCIFKGKVIG